MIRGWILCKPKFQDSYETTRLVEEFKNHNIDVMVIDPHEIDIFVNGIFKKRIIFNENLKRNKSLSIDIKNLNQDFVLVEFYILNPKSPFDILESVDARKKSIKIHSLTLSEE